MGDLPLWIEFASVCKIKYLPEITAKYRVLEESASHKKNIDDEISFLKNALDCRLYYAEKFHIDHNNIDRSFYMPAMKIAFKHKNKELARKYYYEAKEKGYLSNKLMMFYFGTLFYVVRMFVNILYKILGK